MSDEHVTAAEDPAPHIAIREFVLLTGLVVLVVGLLWVRTAKLVPSDPSRWICRLIASRQTEDLFVGRCS